MSENRPRLPSNTMQAAERCISPQNSGLRKSARLLKPSLLHAHQDAAPSTSNVLPSPTTDNAAPPAESSGLASTSKEAAGKLRNWTKWDPTTEYHFFEGLKLYGKDYDAILKYIAQKSKSKTFTEKGYAQIRNFYHNTTTKLLNQLDLSEIDASKEIKELFALINYGEWKRKTNNAKLNAKRLPFFRNLVINGCTTIRLRASHSKTPGKKKRPTCMIRTPVCPALRKYLEAKDDLNADTNVPKNITIELSPNCQRDRAYVLGCWQNPFIRFELNLNQSVSDWLRWLQYKWIPQDLRMRRSLLGEDISSELADLVLYPSAELTLRTVKMNPVGTRPAPAITPSNNPTGAASSVSLNLGLKFWRGPKAEPSSLAVRSDPWVPLSPGKADRKRRKSASATGESDQQLSPADAPSTSSAKRFRQDLGSPASDESEGVRSNIGRQFSDGGDGESSCDAFAPSAAVAETDDDPDFMEVEQKPSANAIADPGTEENSPVEKQEAAVRDVVNRYQPHCVTLNPDILRNGLGLATCESLTVGQLCLMCDKARVIRLKYSILPKVANSLVNAVDAWNFFVHLARSNFSESFYKRTAAPAPIRVISPPASTPAIVASNLAMIGRPSSDHAIDNMTSDIGDTVIVVNSNIDDQRRPEEADGIASDVFVAPQAVKSTKKKLQAKEPFNTIVAKPMAVIHDQSAMFAAQEGSAFLQQIGQMIKKPVVVNRRRAVVGGPSNAYNVASPYGSSSSSQYLRQQFDNSTFLLLPQPNTAAASPMNVKRLTSVGFDATAQKVIRTTSVETRMDNEADNAYRSSVFQPQVMQPINLVASQGSTLNTPDVSLLRSSPETMVCNPPIAQHHPEQQLLTEHVNDAVSHKISVLASDEKLPDSDRPPANPPVAPSDVIMSDSFLDFSEGAFPSFGGKSATSPKRSSDNGPLPNVIHSLRLDTDDSALSSPPRPIRIGAREQHTSDGKNAVYQPNSLADSTKFPSTSNLFPLLDAAGDNESSNTRNFFAACAMATTLETPEKRKGDDRC